MELIECIERIPSKLSEVNSTFQKVYEDLADYLNGKIINEIVYIASGSSLNAALASKSFTLNQCNLKFMAIYPNDFLLMNQYLNRNALYFVISQGGKTKLTCDSLKILKDNQMNHCTITEDIASPIAQLSDVKIEMGSTNEEFLYRTIGYSTTVARCFQIASIVSVEMEIKSKELLTDVANDLKLCTQSVERLIVQSKSWYATYKHLFYGKSKMILAGASYLHAISNEADIKLMEMVPMMTRSFELEELIHGPQNAFDQETIYFLLADQNFEVSKVTAISKFIKHEIGDCVVVGDVYTGSNDFRIIYLSEYFRGIEIITFFQVIAYYLAVERGRDLSKGVNASISKYTTKQI